MKQPTEIIQDFINSGYKHMMNIPGNRVFVTDNSASTLVWVENNVVIEYYMLFPNKITPMHSHPFDNQLIFLSGKMLTKRQKTLTSEDATVITLDGNHIGRLSSICPANYKHGFEVDAVGSCIYNIQIWDHNVTAPLSAAMIYNGTTMGPIHEKLILNK